VSEPTSRILRWKEINFESKPYSGFDQSLDLYQDDSLVLVSMYGHTQGSIGMFVRTSSGKRLFFVGDIVWRASALNTGASKAWLASILVDHDSALTKKAIIKIREAQVRDASLIVVPAHDSSVQNLLGYFPVWVN
jgi:glyoxylase-like metal-dependent hydrolase (beta-lactamase superfamily II)